MTWTWAVDPRTNDVIIGEDGYPIMVSGANEVAQRIRIALQHHYQEYWLFMDMGVPWYQYILGNNDKKTSEALIRTTILSVPGVLSIVNFNASLDADRLWSVRTTVQVNGDVGPEIINIIMENIKA